MAQDFGDDTGEMLIRVLHDQVRDALRRGNPRHHHNAKPDHADQSNERLICIPFNDQEMVSTLGQICSENGISVQPMMDKTGNRYLEFKESDLPELEQAVNQLAQTMTAAEEQTLSQKIESGTPVTEKAHEELEASLANREFSYENRTASICEKVKQAREACTDFAGFEAILNKQGIGLTETRAGEVMFYEARFDKNGNVLPFGRDEQGKRDWAVGADTLKNKWGVDATHDWFGQNTPKQPHAVPDPSRSKTAQRMTDGSLDQDGATPDLNQGIDSHDSMDTDVSTLRMEREQNATDVPPSAVRRESEKSRTYTLNEEVRHKREASEQLASETGTRDRSRGLSDKMKPVR